MFYCVYILQKCDIHILVWKREFTKMILCEKRTRSVFYVPFLAVSWSLRTDCVCVRGVWGRHSSVPLRMKNDCSEFTAVFLRELDWEAEICPRSPNFTMRLRDGCLLFAVLLLLTHTSQQQNTPRKKPSAKKGKTWGLLLSFLFSLIIYSFG